MEVNMAEIIESYVDAHTDDLSHLLEDLLAETESITGRSRWSIGKIGRASCRERVLTGV